MTSIIYHKSDLDGIGSAAIALLAHKDAKLYPAEYGQEDYSIDLFKNEDVMILDFCPAEIKKIQSIAKTLTWIDHHKGNKEKYPELWNNTDGEKSINASAIALTWKYFFGNETMPLVVKFIEDYDLWRFKYGITTKNFYEYGALQLKTPDDQRWRDIILKGEYIQDFINNGSILNYAKEQRLEKNIKSIIEKNLWGHKVGIVNTNHDISETGNAICVAGYDIGLIWRMLQNDVIVVGLRSQFVDVSKIAVQYGGGGHKLASGFSIDFNTFCELIK